MTLGVLVHSGVCFFFRVLSLIMRWNDNQQGTGGTGQVHVRFSMLRQNAS